jgi:hypothetical protein
VILKALKTHGMLLADGGEIALTFADDRNSSAKWADLGIDAQSFGDIAVDQFEVVELGEEFRSPMSACAIPDTLLPGLAHVPSEFGP